MVVPSAGEGNTTMHKTDGNMRKRRGFTLVELVVVVLLIGIIASVAAPKFFGCATDARESTAKQNLAVIRNAIELYDSQYGEFPGQTSDPDTVKTDLSQFLRGPFPACPVGNKNNNVKLYQSGDPPTVSGGEGWAYDNVSGELIINDSDYSSW